MTKVELYYCILLLLKFRPYPHLVIDERRPI